MKFKIMGKKGDAEFTYEDVETQQMIFNELKESGMVPVVMEEGQANRTLIEFDADVDEIIWMRPITGG